MTNTNTAFTINLDNVEEQIAYGSGRVHVEVKVAGFWSSPITLRISREFRWGREESADVYNNWTFDVSHSSGGTESGYDSLMGERNFAMALLATLDYATDQLKPRVPEMEAAYKARRAADEAAYEAERAAKQAKIDADPAIGVMPARAYIDALVENTRQLNGPKVRALRARIRGTDTVLTIVARRNWNDKIQLRYNGSSIGRKEAATNLAGLAFAGLVPDVTMDEDERLKYDRSFN